MRVPCSVACPELQAGLMQKPKNMLLDKLQHGCTIEACGT